MTKEDDRNRLRDLKVTAIGLAVALVVGLLVVGFRYLPGYIWRGKSAWTVTGETLVALLWSLAWTAAGVVTGFLFGIPKVIQSNQDSTSGNASSSSPTQTANLPYQMRVNTNLEEISDWLTKLIVGATLTQIVKIPGYVSSAAHFMTRGVGETGAAFAAAILVYFVCMGFLCGYILTRMFLSGAFALADRFPQTTAALVEGAGLPGSDSGPADPAVKKAAAELATVPISEALSTEQANTLARSALLEKDPARALRAASVAMSSDPKDAEAQLNYAVALSLINANSGLVLDRLKRAHDLMPPDLDAKSKEDMFNTLVYTALYQDPPQGFEAAIQYGEEFRAKNEPTRPSIWINLACAYGQKYAWLKTRPTSGAQAVSDARGKATSAIQQALAIDPASKLRFQQLTDPTSNDNDLAELAKDSAEVRRLLDLPIVGEAQPAEPPNPIRPIDNQQEHH